MESTDTAAIVDPVEQAPKGGRAPAPKRSGPAARMNAPSAEFQQLKDRFLAWMIATRYAETSIKGAHADLEWLYKFLGLRDIKRAADVTPEVLNDYSLWLRERENKSHKGQKLSMAHILHRLTGVKSFCKWLADQMIVLCDPAENLDLPRIVQSLPQVILTQAEARKFLAAPDLRSPVGYRDKALLELLYSTGVRTAELFKLKVSDFDATARTIMIRQGKGGKDRLIPLPVLSSGYVKEYAERVRPKFAKNQKREDGALFLNWTGSPLEKNRLCDIFRRTAKAAGVDKRVTPMALRHSIASHLLENGMDVRYIQEFLGHEKLTTTQIYAKVTLSGLRKHFNKHHPKEKRVRKLKTGSEAEG